MWDVLYRESYEDTPQKTELIPNAVSSSPTPAVPLFAFEEQLPILPEPDEREEIVTKRKRKTRRGKRKRVTVAMEEENISECHRRMEERSASPGVVEPTSCRSAFTLPLPPQQYEETSCGLMSSVARPTVEMEVDNSFVAVEEDVSLFATDEEAPHCLSASAEVSPHMLFDAYEEAPQSLWAVLVESPRALAAWAEEAPSVLTAYEEEHPKVIYAELCESPVEKRPSQLSQEEIRHYVMERLDRGRFSWVLHAEEVCQQQQQQEAPRAVSPSVCGFNLPSHSFSQMDVDGGEATASPPGDSSLYSMPRLYSVSPAPRPPSVEAVPVERSLPQPVSPAPTHTTTTVPKKKIKKRKVVLPGKVRGVPHSTWKATTAAKRETPSTTTEFVKPRQSVLLRKCPFATQNNNIPQPSGKEKELARKASTHRNLQATKNHSRTEKGKKSFAPKKRL
ncbi:hypothetical protein ADEAN_000773700 [Angomonas deanei]|uniref:Uncharacterized protein n=1 Tax=Angomonas deanei TaxID=59799 RepID=A0A7G2CPV5_9TRYP|nr:hypothetical protein ADEAN_000773700 [Angomonas deanei]